MPRRFLVACGFGLLVTLGAGVALDWTAGAESDWPRFRGLDGAGQCDDPDVPVHWGPGDVIWRTELDGAGHSSVCLVGQRLFLTAARSTDSGQVERVVLCLDRADGHVLWRRVARVGDPEKLQRMNSFASATCASDGQRVVAFFGRGGLHCYDMDGKPLWSHDLGTFPGPWGTAASPIIYQDRVIQNCDAEGESYLIAFDKQTGNELWRADRGNLPRGGWNTPFVLQTTSDPDPELILNGEEGIRGYDPDTGNQRWFCRGFNGRGTPLPVYGHGLLVVVCGKPGDIYAVRPGGSGDVTGTHMAWHTPRGGGRDLSSPVLAGQYVFVVNMMGIATCYEATTGRELWRDRLEGNFSASPIVVRGLIYVQNEAGKTFVVKPGPALDVVATNELEGSDDELFRSTMAPSAGQLFFRSTKAVYCVGRRPG